MLRRAFSGQSLAALSIAIVRGKWKPVSPGTGTCGLTLQQCAAVNDLIGRCFSTEPVVRPTATELCDPAKARMANLPELAAEIDQQHQLQAVGKRERQELQESFRHDEKQLGKYEPDAADKDAAVAQVASLGDVPLEERAPDRLFTWGNGTYLPIDDARYLEMFGGSHVAPEHRVVDVACYSDFARSRWHAIVVNEENLAYALGQNCFHGQLGLGGHSFTAAERATKIDIREDQARAGAEPDAFGGFRLISSSPGKLVAAGLRVTQVACGTAHTLALTTGQRVFSWGCNSESLAGELMAIIVSLVFMVNLIQLRSAWLTTQAMQRQRQQTDSGSVELQTDGLAIPKTLWSMFLERF
eukprot:SAG31_NODE_761_length_12276_cov_4.530673_10_plen_356_part_00